ncbi:MAG: DNA primase [Bacteroidetes bacterium]|nr:DNA primase [Bacteroidota bacterium]
MQDIIDKIKELPIDAVLKNYLSLKKAGKNLQACCPFHQEKTPSFSVRPAKNSFKCFGCGVGGDAISFVMKFKALDFMGAVEEICNDHSIDFHKKEYKKEDVQVVELKEELAKLNELAAGFYHSPLAEDEIDEKFDFIFSRIRSWELMKEFEIGLAPDAWDGFLKLAKTAEYKEEFLLKSGLIKESEKGKQYDFFRNRMIFPIRDIVGRLVGFGARVMPGADKKEAKYLNSAESIIYNKSKVLYGLHLAKTSIQEKGMVIITEGYTDVINMHRIGHTNTVATCGTSLTEEHCKILKRYSMNALILRDADKAGRKAAIRDGEMLLNAGFNVFIATGIPEGEDPDSWYKYPNQKIENEDYVMFRIREELKNTETDPLKRAEALHEIGKLLNLVQRETLRSTYINFIAKEYKKQNITKKDITDVIKETAQDEDTEKAIELDTEGLPSYVDKHEFVKYCFYESQEGIEKNQYYYRGYGRISNFVMFPLYHIESTNDTRKLFEILNKYNDRKVIEMDMQSMVSTMNFRRSIESRGNFLFEGSDTHFMHLKRKWYDQTKYCKKIDRLGWQGAGFWAWSNGISKTDGSFIPIDSNGIVAFNDVHYFIPAFSSIYKDDNSIFRDERKFKYIKSENNNITLYDWAEKFIAVYGEQARLTICFYLTTLFSDHIFNKLTNLPMLNIYGQKGTGKNEQAMSLLCLFGHPQNELQINNATKPGISAHLEMFINALSWIDEYKNAMPLEYIEALKAIYNRNGRTRGSIKEGVKKENTQIDSMAIITGQEMLTADVALFSRVLFLHYHNTEHTQEEKDLLEELRAIQQKGLSHITTDILRHRDHVIERYRYSFGEVQTDIMKRMDKNIIDDRIMRNIFSVLASFHCLQQLIKLPFTYEELIETAIDNMNYHNQLLRNTNELSQFWNMLETLVEKDLIKERINFRIEPLSDITINVGANRVDKKIVPTQNVLLLKWTGIYQLYAEYSNRSGINILPESTLLHYIETSKPFIGRKKSVRFDKDTNQALCLKYKDLGINLVRYSGNTVNEKDDDIKPDYSSNFDEDGNKVIAPVLKKVEDELPF